MSESIGELIKQLKKVDKRISKAQARSETSKPASVKVPKCSCCHALGHSRRTCRDPELDGHLFKDCLHPDDDEQAYLHRKEIQLAVDQEEKSRLEAAIVSVPFA